MKNVYQELKISNVINDQSQPDSHSYWIQNKNYFKSLDFLIPKWELLEMGM